MRRVPLLPPDGLPDVVLGVDAEDDVQIGKAQVRIEHQDLLPHSLTRNGHVADHIGFSHPSLPAGDRENPGPRTRLSGLIDFLPMLSDTSFLSFVA